MLQIYVYCYIFVFDVAYLCLVFVCCAIRSPETVFHPECLLVYEWVDNKESLEKQHLVWFSLTVKDSNLLHKDRVCVCDQI